MDERVLTGHSGTPDTDSFPAVAGADSAGPAGPAEAPAPAPAVPDPVVPAPVASPVVPDRVVPAPVVPDRAVPDPVASTAAHAARPPRWHQVPYMIVLAGVLAGLGWAWQGTVQVRAGMVTVAAALLAAALARLVLPERRAGLLAARHRLLDVVALLGLGACILAMALVLPRP